MKSKILNLIFPWLKKYYKALVLVVLLVILLIINIFIYNSYTSIKEKYLISLTNSEALLIENSVVKKQNVVMQFTVSQLEYYNDSINDKLNQARKELKIKDNNLESLQYYYETFTRVDTVTLTQDTIFIKDLSIDTTIVDTFYTCNIKLMYPNIVAVKPNFINEKLIFISSKKETINPPMKLWICRIFQKKHTVLTIDVKDTNPYMETNKTRFIEIIK